jgi:PAC2 family protein
LCEAAKVALYELTTQSEGLVSPALVVALDGWVNAAAAATTAGAYMARGGEVAVTFDADALIDYRARRPSLEIHDGVLTRMSWPELAIRRVRTDQRDVLVFTGPEPDYRWQALRDAILELAARLGIVESVCLGAIPAMVPHTRTTPILVTGRDLGALRGDLPLPAEHMEVPASAVNLVEVYLPDIGRPSVGIWAQVPHYVTGPYHAAALALVERATGHLGVHLPVDALVEQVREERARLDEVVGSRPDARAYLEQLEASGPATSVPPGEDIAAEVERFLRQTTGDPRNPFDDPPTDQA